MSQAQTYYLTEWYASDGLPGSEPEQVTSVADGSGNLYVAGVTLNAYEKYDLHLAKYDDDGDLLWSETFNLTDTTGNVIVGQMILDNSNNPVITGSVYNGTTNRYDALTVKFNTSGVYQWHELYNGSGNHDDGGYDLFCDSYNNIYISGGATDNTDLMDFLVVAYESDGDLLWSRTIDGYGYFDAAAHIHQRSSTQLTVVGVVQQDLDTWELGTQFLYMSTGALSGSLSTYGNTDLDEVRDIVRDGSNNLYVTGYVDNGATNNDIVTLKFSESLDFQWSHTYNGTSNLDDEPHSLTVDEATGNVYVAGFTTKTGEGKNFAVIKYNSSGALQWSNNRNGEVDVDDEAFDVAIDTSGQIIVGGYLTEEGNKDYFVEILSSGGSSQWTERFNGVHNLDDRGQKLVVELSGRISLTGKTGSPDGDTYTTVRYTPESILIPPDDEDPSSALYFTENRGQLLDTEEEAVPEIKFYSDRQLPLHFFRDDRLILTPMLLHVDTTVNDTVDRVDVFFNKAKNDTRIYALEIREDQNNYYLAHIPEGRERVPLSNRLIHTDVFDGIDIQYYSNKAGIKYYVVVNPGADPDDIELVFRGYNSLSVDTSDALKITTDAGSILWQKPEAFQVDSEGDTIHVAWTPSFSVTDSIVGISTGSIDPSKPLVLSIKNTIEASDNEDFWSTYYGGTSAIDIINSITTDNEGGIYACGVTGSHNFPVSSSLQLFNLGQTINGLDAFLIQFSSTGERLWATYYGGSNYFGGSNFSRDVAYDLIVNDTYVYFAGYTNSGDFPLQNKLNAYFDAYNLPDNSNSITEYRGFIVKLNHKEKTREWATYFGDPNHPDDLVTCIDFTPKGTFVIGGFVSVNNETFPSEVPNNDAYTQNDGTNFIAEFNEEDQLIWSTLFTSEDLNNYLVDLDVSDEDEIYVTGKISANGAEDFTVADPSNSGLQIDFGGGSYDAFVSKFDDQRKLIWSSFIGGSNSDTGASIACDKYGRVIVTGNTKSSANSFPLKNSGYYFDNTLGGEQDLFIACFSGNGENHWTTYFGGSNLEAQLGEEPFNFRAGGGSTAISDCNGIYITGHTKSSNIAVNSPEIVPDNWYYSTMNATTLSIAAGFGDAFLLVLNTNPDKLFTTYWGSEVNDNGLGIVTFEEEYVVFGGDISDPFFESDIFAFDNIPLSAFTDSYIQSSYGGGDGFISQLNLPPLLDCNPVAVSEIENGVTSSLQLYPNPATKRLFIKSDLSETSAFTDIRIVDALGHSLNRIETLSPIDGGIDISNLPPSVYFIIATTKRNGHLFGRFVKMHH